MTLPRFLTRNALIGSFSLVAGLLAPALASADTDDGFRGRGRGHERSDDRREQGYRGGGRHRGDARHDGGRHHQSEVIMPRHHGRRGHFRHRGRHHDRHHGHYQDVVMVDAPPVHCDPPVVYAPPPRVHYIPPPPPRYVPQREVVYVEPAPVYVAPPAGVRLTVDPSGASLDINLPIF
ncbi:MAG: hypothetical protein IV100_29540 [Myxococcales bacterium]|nr:hypothetical protein [Myxococcales bacterium]